MKETYDTLHQHGSDILRLTTNTTKMYTHYKSHLGINNARLVDIERRMLAVRHSSAPPTLDGDFDFGQNVDLSASSGMECEVEKTA
jgi:hypothetical protein